ncbi:TetR/AcrR family transcriptional regulator [Paenibacillus sp. CN-4]|uniref:TetR/AcrR family transcriptional regulator n=1 Tax=Paenibacillus nanchangensis TaxID=3348343 RepID=UPI00397DEB69
MQEEPNSGSGWERRQELLGIAVELFAKNGYHKTKISDIVRQAGVAQGTFYWYFKSKEAIVLEIIANGREEITKVISQGYRVHSGTVVDMVQASELLLKNLFQYASENRYLMELLLGSGTSDEAIRQAASETRLEMELAFRRNIERAMELGMLPNTIDPKLRAAMLMSLIEGMIARWLFGPQDPESPMSTITLDEISAQTARFEFFGLLGI